VLLLIIALAKAIFWGLFVNLIPLAGIVTAKPPKAFVSIVVYQKN